MRAFPEQQGEKCVGSWHKGEPLFSRVIVVFQVQRLRVLLIRSGGLARRRPMPKICR